MTNAGGTTDETIYQRQDAHPESVDYSHEPAGSAPRRASRLPLSYLHLEQDFIESCQADNLRQLDLDTYFSLKSAISKRLYRFLGKRFYLQGDWTFDLNEIAFERVGLSRSYEGNAGKIKEKLQPAIEELEAIGFLRPLSRDERYTPHRPGAMDDPALPGSIPCPHLRRRHRRRTPMPEPPRPWWPSWSTVA